MFISPYSAAQKPVKVGTQSRLWPSALALPNGHSRERQTAARNSKKQCSARLETTTAISISDQCLAKNALLLFLTLLVSVLRTRCDSSGPGLHSGTHHTKPSVVWVFSPQLAHFREVYLVNESNASELGEPGPTVLATLMHKATLACFSHTLRLGDWVWRAASCTFLPCV